MKKLMRLEIFSNENARLSGLSHQLEELLNKKFSVYGRQLYFIESEQEIKNEITQLFYDPILENLINNESELDREFQYFIEVTYLPGVTDNAARSAMDALHELGFNAQVASGKIYLIQGEAEIQHLENWAKEHIANPLIQKIQIFDQLAWQKRHRFQSISIPKVEIHHSSEVQTIDVFMNDEDAQDFITKRCLALSSDEWAFIKKYFSDKTIISKRLERGLPELPTDVEIEIIAQSWSEHCKHKIFAAEIDYQETINDQSKKIGNQKVNSLYKSFIKKATFDARDKHEHDWLISVFSDNAGIVRFDSKVDLCIKVETHNSPSALDPYGGALTGILGVNRDIMGTGMGARPIANTDVFCFGSPNLPDKETYDYMPEGPKSPRNIFRGVHKGIEDGGNKSGIPTVNGSFFFDNSYCGKPLVFCGTVGVMPTHLTNKMSASEKHGRSGDKIVVIGGAVGADGIHGATFSSLELDENSPATAVQIGDPLTQKRCLDFLLEAREKCLYSSITDNGAGGISSSIGEMARETNGARIDLAQCTLKYPGLAPWEIMISESQERMSLAVPEARLKDFLALAKTRGVDAQVLGEFTDSGLFEIFYQNKLVGMLSLSWLHDELPQMKLKAKWDGPRIAKSWLPVSKKKATFKGTPFFEVLKSVLRSDNVASKERWVRRYDHEVQGATHIKPYISKKGTSPSNAGVVWLKPHGGEEKGAAFIGHGLAPRYSSYDPYIMAQVAVDEAVRNIVVQGANPEKICLLDNFCWPDPVASQKNPDGDYKLGQLVRTCKGLYDIAVHYGHPFVSGKDSMKNDFRGKDKANRPLSISVLPTLLVTSMGHGSIEETVSPYFDRPNLMIALIGKSQNKYLASELDSQFEIENRDQSIPEVDLEFNRNLYLKFYQAQKSKLILAATDVSDGGLITALCEMSFAHGLGLDLRDYQFDNLVNYFDESPGQLVIGFESKNQEKLAQLFGANIKILGITTSENMLLMKEEKLGMDELYQCWNRDWSEVNA